MLNNHIQYLLRTKQISKKEDCVGETTKSLQHCRVPQTQEASLSLEQPGMVVRPDSGPQTGLKICIPTNQ